MGNEALQQGLGIAAQAAMGVATGGIAPAISAALPAVADLAKSLPNPLDALGGSSSATSGNIGPNTNNQSFGGVVIGDSAIRSPAGFAAAYVSRSGQAAASQPTIPVGQPTVTADGLVYTSSVSASSNGMTLALALGAVALAGFVLTRRK